MSYPFLEDLLADLTGFETGTHFIPTFGLFVALSLLVSLFVLRRTLKHNNPFNIDYSAVESSVFTSFVIGMLGAKLFHVVEYADQGFFDQLFSRGGFSIYGGLAFGFLSLVFLLRRRELPVMKVLDLISPLLLLGYGIGRIGCQLSGDGDWGTVANLSLKPEFLPTWLWAQTYENNIAGVLIASPGVYPTPVYESLMAFAGFFVLQFVHRSSATYVGLTFSLYLIISGVSRFLVEIIRINPRYTALDLSQAQLISLFIVVAGLVLVWMVWRSWKLREITS